ncbi:MAG: hypothetical protein QNK23_13735 [Crocinitomicaceae bacterium]|nr:hypothetical protein [Crocinitomicaceae bacterium]
MIKRSFIASLLVLVAFVSSAQRPHLELGGTLGFKDEFFFHPSFNASAQFTEFHIYDVDVFTRVSKLKWGGEIGLGFEKAGNYFIRRFDNTTEFEYMNLNRISFDLSPYYYLIKKNHFKWDVQLGVRNYFNLNTVTYFPMKEELKIWKLGARLTTNFTFKSVLVGVYYERDLRTDYSFNPQQSVFGLRIGVIY